MDVPTAIEPLTSAVYHTASRFSLYGFMRRSEKEKWRESRFAVIGRLSSTPAVR